MTRRLRCETWMANLVEVLQHDQASHSCVHVLCALHGHNMHAVLKSGFGRIYSRHFRIACGRNGSSGPVLDFMGCGIYNQPSSKTY